MLAMSDSQSARSPSRWRSRSRRADRRRIGVGRGAAEQQQGAARGFAIERLGVVDGCEAAAEPESTGSRCGDVGADRVDGADVEQAGMVEQIPAEQPVAREDGRGESAGLAVEAAEWTARAGGGRRGAWARTRSRSSAVALMVKVMARTCSGEVTDSSASSLRKRWISRPVLPEPAGASTTKERRMSSAWARASASDGTAVPATALEPLALGLRRLFGLGDLIEERQEGKQLSQGLPPARGLEEVGLGVRIGVRIFFEFDCIWVERGEVEAAEQALLAVLAGLRDSVWARRWRGRRGSPRRAR